MAWVSWLSLFMVVAITAAGALIGVNTMYTAITTRMRELATLRVLGFKRRQIATAILIESVAISLLGGLLGTLAAFFANDVPVKLSQGAFFLTVDATVIATSAALAGAIGVLGALLPSIRPLRLTIVEALRHE
jgi:putative ABC transport system permease protein